MEDNDESREEFTVANNEETKETTVQRMKEFCYYLTESIENNLIFCLNLLENRATTKKPNSNAVTVISTISTPIPYVGRGIGSALKEGETFLLNKIDNKNSRTVADLVYFFNDNREEMRRILIESSTEIFYCFEAQFVKLTCEGGPRRAMQKLAKDASNRIISHFLKNKQNAKICKDDFNKGLLFGESLKNKMGKKAGKTVQNEEKTWETAAIYKKVGLYFEEPNEFFEKEETNCGKYGHRRCFTFEDLEEIRREWEISTVSVPQNYNLKKEDLEALSSEVNEYIMKKSIVEEATLDRGKKHEELMDDHRAKHDKVMQNFDEKFAEILDNLTLNYEEMKTSRKHNEGIVTTLKEQHIVEEDRHQELSGKLEKIHTSVLETKQGQDQLQHTTEHIATEICVVKTKQDEFSNTASEVKEAIQQISEQKNPSLSDIVKDNYEVKKVTRLLNEVKAVEPRVRKEIKRSWKKVFK